jgi:ATP-dependent Zn protease
MGNYARLMFLILGVFVFVIFVAERMLQPPQTERLTYSQFYAAVQADKVSKVSISGHEIAGEYRDNGAKFHVTVPDQSDYLPELRKHHVEISVDAGNSTPVIGWILQLVPFILMGVVLIFILRQASQRRNFTAPFDRNSSLGPVDLADQIKKLNDLRISGVLTDDEFQAAKARLLK